MTHRSKSPERAYEEFKAITDEYDCKRLAVTDNIMDMAYFKTLLPKLSQDSLEVPIFYETKSNLRKHHVEMLARSGVREIQPGIESLDDSVLKLMRKGVSGLQNIQLLRWCKQFGVDVSWSILYGFPGESAEAYMKMAELAPKLVHLKPPMGVFQIRVDRFSPYFTQPEELGMVNLQPFPSYSYVYRMPPEKVRKLAYFFSYEYALPRNPSHYTAHLKNVFEVWFDAYEDSDCLLMDTGEALQIWDLRPRAESRLHVLEGEQRTMYLRCDEIASKKAILKAVNSEHGLTMREAELEAVLQPLVDAELLLEQDGSYLSLAVPTDEYTPSEAILENLEAVSNQLGVAVAGRLAEAAV